MSRSHSTYVRTAAFLLYVILLHIGQKGEGRLHASSFAATSSASSPACFKNVVRTWRADWRERERIVPSPWALSAMSSTITFYVWNAMEKTSFESLFTVFFFLGEGRQPDRRVRVVSFLSPKPLPVFAACHQEFAFWAAYRGSRQGAKLA